MFQHSEQLDTDVYSVLIIPTVKIIVRVLYDKLVENQMIRLLLVVKLWESQVWML